MVKAIIIFMILQAFIFSDANALAQDKQKHLAVSFLSSAASYYVLRKSGFSKWQSVAGSIIAVSVVGLVKKSGDAFVDNGDIAANTVGSTAGALIGFSLNY